MALQQNDIDVIARAIAEAVPEDLLVQVVARQNQIPDLDDLRKTAVDADRGRLYALAAAVLSQYDAKARVHELLLELYRKVDWSPTFLRTIDPFAVDPGLTDDMRQALHRRRDHFISSPNLMRFAREFEPRICCIIGSYLDNDQKISPIGGTGFLVAPDLILTAAHVFERAIAAIGESEVPKRCAVFFDYIDPPEITDHSVLRNAVRRVELADDWHVQGSSSLPDDGSVDITLPGRDTILANNLDFTLVRLSEAVGLESIELSGGRRRHWIELPKTYPLLGVDSYVIIAQHPRSYPRMVGFGRYVAVYKSVSRFWYGTETDKGSSGAPCLTRNLALVGLHNAEYNPTKFPEKGVNQAVRIDLIAQQIASKVSEAIQTRGTLPTSSLIWNLAPPASQPRLVIGRLVYLRWLDQAIAGRATVRADRIYAADAPDEGAGKTFSTEILRHALSANPEQRLVVFGSPEEGMPTRIEDMIRVLADHLGVPASKLNEMPKRPGVELPTAAADGDKFNRWASQTMPEWLARTLDETRPPPRDVRAEAIRERERLKTTGQPIPLDLAMSADSAEPILVEDGWRSAWIVFDRLNETRLAPELLELVAGLSGARIDEDQTSKTLKRLRWVFLGYRPDCFAQGHVTVERLDPALVSAADAELPLRNAWSSRGQDLPDAQLGKFLELFGAVIQALNDAGAASQGKLVALQGLLGSMVNIFPPPNVK
ncbi:trypsin-like serine peptidase [Hansschlegelia quercus]|uniref:Serine protease n=1 Tax=Hansschlegelia quercus TaxID=2528245 RepID=A0A4Q9GNV0_9HYPH|nr:serine protease [Hansschlegelia quercus]TBN54454.1 serine protease [Hansschlegelia quercus]